MTGKFAYSFDRDSYQGAFDTRAKALAAAVRVLGERSDIPEGIYVGQWAEPDPQADHHAEVVLQQMRERFNVANSDSDFLHNPTENQLAELDAELEKTLRAWLTRNNLLPRPTRVRAVSEHPLPTVHHVAVSNNGRETSLMGEA